MPTNTSKLNLVKPLAEENYDVGVFNANADKIDLFATATDSQLADKVDKITGKGLSTEDYTTAEKEKVSNLPLDTNSKLAEISYRLENSIANGDFSQGVTGWLLRNGVTASTIDDYFNVVMTETSIDQTWRLEQSVDIAIPDHKYYVSGEINPKLSNSSNIQFGAINLSGFIPIPNVWNKSRAIITASTNARFRFYHNTTGYLVGDSIKFRRFMAIDLTDLYGAGNEPTIEVFEKILNIAKLIYVESENVTVKDILSYLVITDKTDYTVKATGGDFTTIQSAINAVKPTKEKPVNIFIDSGIYNEELIGKDWVNLIGKDRDTTIIQSLPSLENIVDRDVIKAHFNMKLKNLTINGEHVKYCIHQDSGVEHNLILENCNIDKKTSSGFGSALGLGLRANQNLTIKNCKIRGDKWGIYWHNWNDQLANSVMDIENSYIEGTTEYGMYCQSLGSDMTDLIILKGNKFVGGLHDIRVGRNTNYGHNQDDITFIASGNEVETYAKSEGSNVPFVQPIVVPTVETVL